LKPATVIELGTFQGASAAWMGNICNAMKLDTKIYTVDVDISQRRSQPVEPDNVVYLEGDLNKETEALPEDLMKVRIE
jgi:cephalosporin hydroxylase